ncbi:MAG: hypothetical protein QNK85_02405 [Crocinitomicaceae bacterium]
MNKNKPTQLSGFIFVGLAEYRKLVRKFYSIEGCFLHREAFKSCMYESQVKIKKYRVLDKTLGAYFKTDDLYSQLYKKHFKKAYAGKPTKRYLLIMEQIQKAESIPLEEITRITT